MASNEQQHPNPRVQPSTNQQNEWPGTTEPSFTSGENMAVANLLRTPKRVNVITGRYLPRRPKMGSAARRKNHKATIKK